MVMSRTLMCPDECHGLSDVFGEEFEKLYTKYEERFSSISPFVIDARGVVCHFESQIETGTPYLCYKDASNIKSNQRIQEQLNLQIYARKLQIF